MQTIFRALFSVLLAVTVLLTGCTSQTVDNTAASPTETAAATPSTPASVADSLNPEFSNLPRLNGEATVEMTVKGNK
ncbi:MAG TPA: peptidylprolyl isomerase, partial [Allocoleopsis sp.]